MTADTFYSGDTELHARSRHRHTDTDRQTSSHRSSYKMNFLTDLAEEATAHMGLDNLDNQEPMKCL